MKVRIHRGAAEIGGNCIELESSGARLLLDLGRPLSATRGEHVPLPDVAGLAGGSDASLLGVVISHPHQDHYGLLEGVPADVPFFIGEAAHRILDEAAFFTPGGLKRRPAGFLRHRVPLQLGPFRLTPYLADHSAFDAYSLLVEAGGRRLFYSGDFRGHGRKAGMFSQLLDRPPKDIHALMMEGTNVRPAGASPQSSPTERDVEEQCLQTFKQTPGMALVAYSGQNVDRLVTLYRAAKRAGRELVVDLYTATMAQATGHASIPQPGWDGLRVFVPKAQRVAVKRAGEFHRVNALGDARIYGDELKARRAELVMTFRGSMTKDLELADCLEGAHAVWSQWRGYLEQPDSAPLLRFLAARGIGLSVHHSSGHATVTDLGRLVAALKPERVVPIHSLATARFGEYFPRVRPAGDGVWWQV